MNALNDLSDALELDPSLIDAYLLRSRILIDNGELDKAIADLTTASNLDLDAETLSQVLHQRAICFSQINDLKKALEDFNRSNELAPGHQYIDYDIGVTLLHFGNINEALDKFDQAIEINPNDGRAYNSRAIGLAVLGRHNLALKEFSKAIRLIGDETEAAIIYRNMAMSYELVGEIAFASNAIVETEKLSQILSSQ